jgi:hypothetical protein
MVHQHRLRPQGFCDRKVNIMDLIGTLLNLILGLLGGL